MEILKGPAGVEFGVGEPGGFVNYVTKKPLDHFALSFGSERGSYDYYGGYFDATGPLWTPAKDTSRWLLSGFSVGAGVIYMGDRNGDDANTFILPSYWRFDAGWYYQWRNLNFKLTCDNLLDRRFQLASQDRNFNIQPGEPRLLNFATEVHF